MEERDDKQNHQRTEHDSPAAYKRHRWKTNIKFDNHSLSLSVETAEKFWEGGREIVVFSGQWRSPSFSVCLCVAEEATLGESE